METVDIRCPKCGKVLRLQRLPGIENKIVPCPVCGTRTPFSQCGKVQAPKETCDTELPASLKKGKAFLVDRLNNRSYELPLGRNVVGRAHATSSANVQIVTDDKGISRSHSVIEVINTASGKTRCIISNAQNKNATYINGEKLEDGDELYLKDGDIVKMSISEFCIEITF